MCLCQSPYGPEAIFKCTWHCVHLLLCISHSMPISGWYHPCPGIVKYYQEDLQPLLRMLDSSNNCNLIFPFGHYKCISKSGNLSFNSWTAPISSSTKTHGLPQCCLSQGRELTSTLLCKPQSTVPLGPADLHVLKYLSHLFSALPVAPP